MTASQTRQVIPHPLRSGFWTIQIGNSIYGEFDRRELAIAIMLTR
jgi:hypothetical protein